MIPKNSKKTAGFTMIEMAIVAVLVGVLATLAVPMFTRTLPRLKCHAEARNLLSAVRVARSRAIAENIQYGVYFDTNARTYIIFKDIVNQTQYRYNGGDSIVMGPVALDANVVYTGITFSGNSIVMFPPGPRPRPARSASTHAVAIPPIPSPCLRQRGRQGFNSPVNGREPSRIFPYGVNFEINKTIISM